jgi:hypothetical protein
MGLPILAYAKGNNCAKGGKILGVQLYPIILQSFMFCGAVSDFPAAQQGATLHIATLQHIMQR